MWSPVHRSHHGEVNPDHRLAVELLTEAADRLDDLAEMAELMDDHKWALHYRQLANEQRREAMTLLDDD